jgi:PilZ domain
MPSITGLRISPPGIGATLVDISTNGLLAESEVAPRIGQAVEVTFEGTFSPAAVEGQVVRSAIAAMAPGGIRYHVAVAFTTPIALDPQPDASDEVSAAPAIVTDPQPDDIFNRW